MNKKRIKQIIQSQGSTSSKFRMKQVAVLKPYKFYPKWQRTIRLQRTQDDWPTGSNTTLFIDMNMLFDELGSELGTEFEYIVLKSVKIYIPPNHQLLIEAYDPTFVLRQNQSGDQITDRQALNQMQCITSSERWGQVSYNWPAPYSNQVYEDVASGASPKSRILALTRPYKSDGQQQSGSWEYNFDFSVSVWGKRGNELSKMLVPKASADDELRDAHVGLIQAAARMDLESATPPEIIEQ